MSQNDQWWKSDAPAEQSAKDEWWKADKAQATAGDRIKDAGLSLAKGVVAVPEAGVGIADIFTGGRVGKALENEGGAIGFRPRQAKEFLSGFQSEAYKDEQRKFSEAEGIVDKAIVAVTNPALVGNTVIESLPSMFAGSAAARGIGKAAGVGQAAMAGNTGRALAAGGEGAMMAGMQASEIRGETEDGLLTPKQSALAAGTGIVGGAVGFGGAQLAKRFGVGDVDQMIASGMTTGIAKPGLGMLNRAGRGAFAEAAEELPQSLAETGLQNIALDRPFTQGMDEAAVLGTLAGGAMGAGGGIVSGFGQPRAKTDAPPVAPPAPATPPVQPQEQSPVVPEVAPLGAPLTGTGAGMLGAPVDPLRSVIRPSEAMGLNPAAGPLSAAAATAVDSGASPVAMPVAVRQADQQPAPDLAARSTEELRTELRNAQDPAIRKAVAAELAKRKKEEAAALPDPLQPSLIDQPQGEPAREPSPPQAVQASQEEPQAPAAQPAGELKKPRGILAKKAERDAKKGKPNVSQPVDGLRPDAGASTGAGSADAGARMGQMTRATAGPGFTASDVTRNVQDAPQGAAEAETAAAPAQAPEAARGDAADVAGVPAEVGAGQAQADGVGRDATKPSAKPRSIVAKAAEKKSPFASKEDLDHLFGTDQKRKKAMDRIAKGTAYFGTGIKAREFINGNGLKDTHEVFQAKPSRFEVRAKAGQGADPAVVTAAAHEAATSPKNDLPQPTEAQKEAGNYKKGHVTINGLNISIENPAGSRRRPEWPPLKHHYGYFKGSVGADKDHVDVFLTDKAGDASLPVFVVDQVNKDGSFDEHKVVMGTATEEEARAAYLANYEKGWTGLGAITQMPLEDFKAWVMDPAKTAKRADAAAAQAEPEAPTPTTKESTAVAPAKPDPLTEKEKAAKAKMLAAAPDRLQFAKYDLARAKKAAEELNKTSMPDVWPDMDKLEKARADHKDVLKRLAGEDKKDGDKPEGDVQFSIAEEAIASEQHSAPSGPHAQAVKAFADRLSKQRERPVQMQAVSPGTGEQGKKARTLAGIARKLFNRDVVFVRFTNGDPLFNGAVSSFAPGKVFINIDSPRPMMAVLGHELLHEFRKNDEGAYQSLIQRLDALLADSSHPIYAAILAEKYRKAGMKNLPRDIREELYADIVGDHFTEAEFWQALTGTSTDKPLVWKRVLNKVMEWLQTIGNKLRRVKSTNDGDVMLTVAQQADGQRPFGTDKFITDVEASRQAVLQAFRTFDGGPARVQGDSDIRFSIADAAPNNARELTKPVVQLLNDTFQVKGKLNWWHKTVGTPFNLAKRVPEFKRVFDSVQDFINDVSFYGAEAAAKAPKIIPKLETWRDLGKSPIKAEDNKAIAAPIFEGTLVWMRDESGRPVKVDDAKTAAQSLTAEQKAQRLLRNNKITENVLRMWKGMPVDQYEAAINSKYERDMLSAGIVWTDAELRSQFNLSDDQIELYKEFRAATDKSLTDLALSDIIQYVGKDADPIKDVVMGKSLAEGSEMIRDYLLELAESDPDRRNMLIETANSVIDKADRVQQLMDRGYAPLQRFGRYTVYAQDENGEQLFFGMYENRWAAARATRQMRQQFPDARIETGVMSEEAYKMFQGISPETLEIFGSMLGMDSQADGATNEAFQTYLKLAKSNRSAMKRLIERKGISGYSEDASRVLASFLYSNARQTASNLHVGEILNGVNDIPKQMGDAKDMAMKLARYTMDPQEEALALRGLLFAQYLGGSIASAAINALQPAQVTFPYLSQYVGVRKSASLMAQAVKDALKRETGDARLDAALKKAEEDGIVSPQEIFQLMAQAQGKATLRAGDGTKAGDAMAAASNTLSRLSLGWGKVFSIPEQFNRRSTFIAAYRAAVDNKLGNPAAFAEEAVKATQFVYNKGNRPAWARGAIGATVFTFKTYSISYVELMQRMAASGPEGRRAAALMVGVLFLMAGAGGLPGVEDAEDLVDGIAQRVLGLNFHTRQKREEWLTDVFGQAGARFIENGLSGLPWSPTDVSGRLGLGNLIPGTGIFLKKQDYARDVTELVGPAGDMTKRFLEGAGLLMQGEVLKAAEIVSPVAVRNMIQGGRMAATDQYTDQKGRKVIETTPVEAATKLIGFQPANVARVQESTRTVQKMVSLNKIREAEIADKWAKAIVKQDQDGIEAARQELAKWNRANPESPISISIPQLRRRVQALQEDKATRMMRTAPKELRQEVARELQEIR